MKKSVIIISVIALVIVVLFLLSYTNITGFAVNNGQAHSLILVKFYQTPDLSQSSFFGQIFGKPKIITKFPSINNLIKKYDLSDSAFLFDNTALENVYQFKVVNAGMAVSELKLDPNVEYARLIETGFDKQVKKNIDDLNQELTKEGATWKADYTLQSIYTDEDRAILAGTLVEAGAGKGNSGKANTATCNDSDGGKDYNVKGTTCSGTNCNTDSCSGSQLTEYSCGAKGAMATTIYTCLSGCSNGACNQVCVPSCSGKQCGASDGCGGVCLTGSCPAGQSCTNGACISLNLPSVLDWRNVNGKNYMTAVKNQGQCGSCWAFADIGAFEGEISAYYNNVSINKDLSEQDIVSCSGAGSCAGGYPSTALGYIQNTGVAEESCFSYTSSDTSCSNKCSTWQQNPWKLSSSTYVYGNDAIKKALIASGPLVTIMYVFNDFYYYHSGIYNTSGLNYVGGHAIVIVGYGNDLNGNLYWIAKNSWGTGWGEAGYFRIYAGTSGFGSETYAINSPVPSTTQPQAKVCEDKDNDGYCNWGLGSKPSSGCPVCNSTEDCDDSNSGLNVKC